MVANSNARVDDVVNLFNYPNHATTFVDMPEALISNREMDAFFKKNEWSKYTLESIDEISVDAKEFINNYIISKARNVCFLF